jgi:DNA polymerase-3 subunit chi
MAESEMQVDFYHLTVQPLDRVLPRIAERVVETGGRLLVVAESEIQRISLDKLLWTYAPESFLAHSQAGGEGDSTQPILISGAPSAANDARNIALVDGVWREEALGFDRAFHFFDGDRIGEARLAWKALADRDGIERRYWKQSDSGKWEQAA